METDAFTLSWANLQFYAFPPFALILKMLAKIRADKATGIVVVPDWPNQPWYPLFYKLLAEPPLLLKDNKKLLSGCFRDQKTPPPKMSLIVGKLSGNLF